ncbi:MAG: thiamine pyrophosphate-binding protein [Alphaproteobacteria bacterium]|nr:thiamine pyrophosphate-binding protein [Alphaproteobacteria bacterium]
MNTRPNMRTGGQILVDALRLHGTDMVFCVPGESYLATLDAFHDAADAIRLIVCRQEGGAANMAEAYGKLTGRPGICFVTRGPGATHASVAIHTAHQDSTPLVLFVGQVGRSMIERDAFQEIDYRRMFGQFTKWVAQIDDPARVPEMVSRAFHTATSGRPGPVVLALPEDMQTETAAVEDGLRYHPIEPAPDATDMIRLHDLLSRAKRPLMMVGGGGWSKAACRDIVAFAEANDLPTIAAFRRQDVFDNTHRNYAGDIGLGINPALQARVREADLLLVVGAQLTEIITGGYTLFDMPKPRQTLIHVHPGIHELARVYQGDLLINAGMNRFAHAARLMAHVTGRPWGEWARAARADYERHLVPEGSPGAVDLAEIVIALRTQLPRDAIIANGAGNYTVWVHRFYQWRDYGTQLAPQSGSMGYGVPASITAALLHPDRPVVSFAGDGCFLMNGQELATAVQYGAKVVYIVVNNGIYGTIRMHQEREYPGRISGTGINNPDFAAYARAFGAHGELVTRTADFAAAFDRARAHDGPALIELRVDPEAITPKTTLRAIRDAALAKSKKG